ncbi:MAG: bifunctional hydroxymethylpyrimidine kinase/phosphomethylpyrimidine kinase [Deltaproteobacteria bacterium]|nr:bifunctional hydroxymethylpyrimidine kinase/phosphomethylpyrimidine kinase [Deltaproteobacteria bacterium]
MHPEVVSSLSGLRLVVLGDLVADVYLHGTTRRISREAPVLIVQEEHRELRPGGAANAAANIRSLGGIPLPVGLLGDDEEGRGVLEHFERSGVDTAGILLQSDRLTTTKTRVLGGGANTVRQQMLRIDRLNPALPAAGSLETLCERLRELLGSACGLVVSDYGEGVVQGPVFDRVLELARKGARVFVDSRHRVALYRGVEAVTPNEPELAAATGRELRDRDALESAASCLLRETGCRRALVKRGRHGLALFEPERPSEWLAAHGPVEVADVTGAGDTVLAAFSLACCAGLEPQQAARIANTAGGIKVSKMGSAAVTAEELRRGLAAQPEEGSRA